MIYTVTLNPCIDCIMHFNSLNTGVLNRAFDEDILPGGKGINVSLLLNELGIPSTALGFIGGYTGDIIEKSLESKGIKTDFTRLKDGNTRINVKLIHGTETELNAPGPVIDGSDLENFYKKLEFLKKDDILVLSGSAPKGLSSDIYAEIIKKTENSGVKTVIDAEGELLLNALKFKPFLIKPNESELKGLFGETGQDIITLANKLKSMGAANVLVSRGGKGAVLLAENGETISVDAIKGKAVNTVGAGDAMLAGFIAGFSKTNDYSYSLRLANACGAAAAFSKTKPQKTEILNLLR